MSEFGNVGELVRRHEIPKDVQVMTRYCRVGVRSKKIGAVEERNLRIQNALFDTQFELHMAEMGTLSLVTMRSQHTNMVMTMDDNALRAIYAELHKRFEVKREECGCQEMQNAEIAG